MTLSDVSIRNPVFAWMLMIGLILFGAISFSRMGVSQLPDVDFPVLTISVTMTGAAPEVMETTVVDPIEDTMMSVEGVRTLTSSSSSGSASITLEFELDRDINVALQDVQAKLAQVQSRLPKEALAPVISKTNPDDNPILWLALVYDKGDMTFLMKYARDYVKDRFTTIEGVGDIFIGGYTDPQLRVWVKPEQLPKYNLSVNDILDAIQDGHSELPGGFVEDGNKSYNVRTMGEAHSVKEFEQIVITKRAGQTIQDPSQVVRMGQVARVEQGLDEVTRISRFNGQPALGLGIRKQRGSNAVAVARAVKAKLTEVNKQLPEGMHIEVNFDSTRFIEDSVHELNKHLVLAVILTSIVCWVFLGSWTATLNVLLSIPTSIMGAFIGLYFLGFTLNTFTLLGLTLAIGIVVDDAILVLENIFRHNEQGKNSIESAIIGSREIAFAAMAATIAVVAIFLPVAFMQGVIGKFFFQFGMTISLAVVLSLLESLTITPMRCATFVHTGERTTRIGKMFENTMEFTKNWYEKLLRLSLNHRWQVMALSIVIMAVSFFSVKFIRKEFSPAQDQSMFMVRLTLPIGSSLAYTDQQTKLVEKWLRDRKEIRQVYVAVGGFGGGVGNANSAVIFATMNPRGERGTDSVLKHELSQQEFMDVAREAIAKVPDVKPVMVDFSQRGISGGKGFAIEFTLLGPDWNKLSEYSTALMKEMEASGLVTDVDTDYRVGMPEIQILPDRVRAAQHGINIEEIAKTVNALIGGVLQGQFPQGGHRYDIRVQMEKVGEPLKRIEDLYIGNARSNLIKISEVVKREVNPSLQTISRLNRQRAITITANMKQGKSQPEAMAFIEKSASKMLAPGYMIAAGGASKSAAEGFRSLMFALVMGLVVAYMVLASQFNSFLDPTSILMALPFSFTGAFFALWVSGESLNMYSMIGLLLLMGIVKKNSILLVEFTNQVREHKETNANSALIEACPVRLRPILMTSFATVASAIPSALAMGSGSETARPMAVALIGGVLVSTALTLVAVPCVYSLLDRFRRRDRVALETKKAFAAVTKETELKELGNREAEISM
jgi:HAE1 family hydrophobic/amphiphilic exporter-1